MEGMGVDRIILGHMKLLGKYNSMINDRIWILSTKVRNTFVLYEPWTFVEDSEFSETIEEDGYDLFRVSTA